MQMKYSTQWRDISEKLDDDR